MSAKKIVRHCSPTLAGIKTGNLFNCEYETEEQLKKNMGNWNKVFNEKGIYMYLLRKKNNRALIYVFRKKHLMRDLQVKEIQEFLTNTGYTDLSLDGCLMSLKNKLKDYNDFPHEIGVFLGYPLMDIKAFIENKGRNYKSVGIWKVYTNPWKAKKTFEKYKKCTEIYCQREAAGMDITQLAIVV